MTPSMREIARRMDPVRPPNRLRGAPTPWLDSGGSEVTAWLIRDDVIEAARIQPESASVGLAHRTDKGLDQVHRWPSTHLPVGSNPRAVSLRALARRHADTSRAFRFLWYNTWLLSPPLAISAKPLIERRAKEIARAISDRPYDIAALCEVFSGSERDSIMAIVGQSHGFDWARGPEHTYQLSSGLFTLAIDRVKIVDRKGMVFEYEGGGLDSYAEKGVLHTELELAPDAGGFAPRIDLFTTHMHAVEPATRRRQLVELHDFIVERRKPTNPTLVAGDFNVDNRDPEDELFGSEYVALLNTLGQLGLSDVWLSRGSLAGTTSVDEDPDQNVDYRPACLFDTANRFASCEDYPSFRPGSTAPVPGKRLDYVLVEQPREQHNVMIDLTRLRRLPFFRGSESLYGLDSTHMFSDVPDTGPNTPSFMSDHLGLELELIVTPMADVVEGMGGGG